MVKEFKQMSVGFANSGGFQSIKIQVYFIQGEGFPKKSQWVSLILDDFRVSELNIFFNHGEEFSEKCQWVSSNIVRGF